MKNSLSDLIDIKIGDIISVVGSGGKTTFIYNLAKEIKNEKILISTTTKMLYPEENQVDYFFSLAEDNEISIKEGRTFIAGEKVSKNKISGDISLIGVSSGKCGFTTLREIKLVFSMVCRLLYKFYFLSNLSKIESLNYFQDKSYGTV